jgi:hypothetical protein
MRATQVRPHRDSPRNPPALHAGCTHMLNSFPIYDDAGIVTVAHSARSGAVTGEGEYKSSRVPVLQRVGTHNHCPCPLPPGPKTPSLLPCRPLMRDDMCCQTGAEGCTGCRVGCDPYAACPYGCDINPVSQNAGVCYRGCDPNTQECVRTCCCPSLARLGQPRPNPS